MKSFNLSEWALNHRSMLWYFMIVFSVAGLFSYLNLGREEDPAFTIKTMIISAQWPGATAEDTIKQVTERIEKKLEELPQLDYTRSMTRPGETVVFVNLLDTTAADEVASTWMRARNLVGDIRNTLPNGVIGPQFNDNFGDVYGNIFAFTSDGFSTRELRDFVEDARSKVLTISNVGKVDVIGAQDEVIFLEFSPRRLAAYGISQQNVVETLQSQNAVVPSGVIQADGERISIRVTGQFTSEESLRNLNLRINDRFFRLSDVADIRRGYVDPPSSLFRYNGEPAIGLAVGMKAGANLLAFGEELNHEMDRIVAELPVGIGVHLVSDQPQVVEEAVSGFTTALFEAIAIVLVVSFVSLGFRAGLVVAVAIPLTLAITFLVMEYLGISLQRISLGALIIALGLLVDDAMIAVEMMVARLEAGDTIHKAATSVWTSTAFPMLTGTLVTVAGFIPVGLNTSAAGEFTFTLFVVIAVSLVLSWIVAVLFTPLIGVIMLPKTMRKHHEKKGLFARFFARLLLLCLRWRWVTIASTLAVFALSIYGMQFVQQQFFPSSDRTELIVDWNLPQNASVTQTTNEIVKFEKEQLTDREGVERWSSYIGQGAPRFVLSLDVQPGSPAFGQTIIVTSDLETRDRLRREFTEYLTETFPNTDAYVKLLDIGPPVGRPVAYRLSGPDIQTVRRLSFELGNVLAENPSLGEVVYDWSEPSRVVRIDVMQDRARQLGVSSETIASTINGIVGGSTVTEIRDDIYMVDIVGRAVAAERSSIETLRDLQLPTANGQSVPLAAVAEFGYEVEQPLIWTRSRIPTLTIRAGITSALQPATVVQQLTSSVDEFTSKLPAGYRLEVGGSVEDSGKGQAPIVAVVPLMLFAMATILMVQLQSFSRLFLVFAVAPLAVIGVVAALLPSGAPMGFVAILGILALIGILIRNSVILVVQIEEHIKDGFDPWTAVVDATEHRMRPILLTAAAASLALIPIASEVFWGPMAYAMMGGIIVGTVLTLLFLPALYVACFRIKAPARDGTSIPDTVSLPPASEASA
ncbi:efflux RND transporter permease subunit [Tianweitania sediminis]|uniref:Efflux RND transporter permease subunit n=1 Tax=Tianweitania sediminis TaxID=1502156 RepID=A0A8J7RSY7_9HYPH|nr:efflux RND transporter permease subunit [Tianweitania sediminis]MBP0441474.1 efflux RND transporter permease subunit [Tianweitania sediminis]